MDKLKDLRLSFNKTASFAEGAVDLRMNLQCDIQALQHSDVNLSGKKCRLREWSRNS